MCSLETKVGLIHLSNPRGVDGSDICFTDTKGNNHNVLEVAKASPGNPVKLGSWCTLALRIKRFDDNTPVGRGQSLYPWRRTVGRLCAPCTTVFTRGYS